MDNTSAADVVVAVIGGTGGVGCTTVAASLSAAFARDAESVFLLDLDPRSGGIDVLLGVEGEAGTRWSGLLLAGGHLAPAELAAGLPRWGPVAVLANDGPEVRVETAVQAIGIARRAGPVVLDLGRLCGDAAFAAARLCTLALLLVRADLPGLTAARTVRDLLLGEHPGATLAILVRAGGTVDARRAARAVGDQLVATVPTCGRIPFPLIPQACPPPLMRVMQGIAEGVAA